MPNSPVQVVLNSNQFVKEVIPPKGYGGKKDFYHGKNAFFAEHKQNVLCQLESLHNNKDVEGKYSYAKVKLIKQAARAKSHRPVTKIFTNANDCRIVGGGRYGELVVELGPSSIDKIMTIISDSAEVEIIPRTNRKGETVEEASACRCEVGVIDKIELYDSHDKTDLDVHLVAESLVDSGLGFYVELFDVPAPRQDWDLFTPQRLSLYKTFLSSLNNIQGIRLSKSQALRSGNIMYIRLTDTEQTICNFYHSIAKPTEWENSTKNIEKYERLLNILIASTLVR